MKVTLISHTPEPEKTVAAAAKLCYSKTGITGLMDGLTDEKASQFLQMLESMGHASPIEHASFTFGIEGVSRSFLAQITRHRIGSYSVQSQRYVIKSGFETIVPPAIEAIPEAKAEFEAAMASCGEYYDRLTEILTRHHAKELEAEGKSPEEAARLAVKMAIEDARYVLPNACDTKMVVTMNARSLHNFFEKRCCNRAQWEIHQVADEMLALVYAVAPSLFAHAGPPCLNGPCPEGKMSCGKAAQVRERYQQLKERTSNG
ncbi:MAG TPA: FAD-dependent thymidylate synthase [Firmicutes bacterium]|nr:FAD-dependent thymidylate synthase [Bacillota bacterium]